MGMGMSMGIRLTQSMQITQRIVVTMPNIQWSLVHAFQSGNWGPPPFVPPTFEGETFEVQLKLEGKKIPNFDTHDHITKMRLVDEANEVFRFAYTQGEDAETGEVRGYYKIPLLRDISHNIQKIRVKISRTEYERATAILRAVGEMARIVHAIPYHRLYQDVATHLREDHNVGLDAVALVSVDRGGRIPCIVLQHALGFASMESLKVDQGGGHLDEDRLREFVARQVFVGKHVLFVDSTVDSGRQIRVLERYFDDKTWKQRLGHRSWSLVGSNDHAQNLPHHRNINWGVDPDATFEDDPDLMGVDYALGSNTKVVDRPSEASIAIRKALLSVPEGYIFTADDIDKQIADQMREWRKRNRERLAKHEAEVAVAKAAHAEEVKDWKKQRGEERVYDAVERETYRITGSKKWRDAVSQAPSISLEALPAVIPNGTSHVLHNILVVGSGNVVDVPPAVADLVADTLGPHHSLFAGTKNGNPGAILSTVIQRIAKPEVRLYKAGYSPTGESFGGTPVVVLPEKEEMRRQMVKDSHLALVFGGKEGTLREVLLALKFKKPVILIKGWGAIPSYLAGSKKYSKLSHLAICNTIPEALEKVLDLTAA